MTERLRFEQLAVRRGDRLVVRDLAGAVGAGQALHVSGPNGAGKTSLLEVLVGLRPAAGGRVAYGNGVRPAWVGHRNGLDPTFSIHDNLSQWCALEALDPGPVGAVLDAMGLRSVAAQTVRSLSEGQQRRAALCRLPLSGRGLWILDEPLAALDSDGARRLEDLLERRVAQGGAVVYSSHQALPVRGADALTLSLS